MNDRNKCIFATLILLLIKLEPAQVENILITIISTFG